MFSYQIQESMGESLMEIAMNSIPVIIVADISELSSFSIRNIKAFPDTPETREEAEKLFQDWIIGSNPGILDDELQEAVDNGKFEVGYGGFYLFSSL